MANVRLILLGLLLAQLADAVTFAIGVSRLGIEFEANQAAAALYRIGGLEAVLIAKLAAILAAIGLLTLSASRYPLVVRWGGSVAIAVGFLGFAANSAAIVLG